MITVKSKPNLIFFLLVLLIFIYILVAALTGSKQDDRFLQDRELYQQINSLISSAKFAEAEPVAVELVQKYPHSYVLLWEYALSLAGQSRNREARIYFVEVQKQRPFIINNQTYVYQFGKLLNNMGDYNEAGKYLTRAQKLNTSPQLSEKSRNILQEIKNKRLGDKNGKKK